MPVFRLYTLDDLEELDDAPDAEIKEAEEKVVDQASAARTIAELQAEIGHARTTGGACRQGPAIRAPTANGTNSPGCFRTMPEMFDAQGHRRKLVIFTEHRDTLNYLTERIRALIGKPEAVVVIHGGVGREERKKAEESFKHDKDVEILVATDAAGEGINLQRAHLMVNYDLPWNPNRLEQRFGASTASARRKSATFGISLPRTRAKAKSISASWRSLTKNARHWEARSSTCWDNSRSRTVRSANCCWKPSATATSRRSNPARSI